MTDRHDLARFVRAQAGIYDTALAEWQQGEKRSHWMWYVFPQIVGLGRSENARTYAIADPNEAAAYVSHDILGKRLRESADAVLEWAGRKTATGIFGPAGALKLRSSMTLFETVAPTDERFGRVLHGFFGGKRDPATSKRLAG
ncbi:DUF1810 domain-containing protein [Aurantiacibacter aquimixticola]|uniref:DUF1810 family protein n=1 Tax=Aurantiacibacter aquimixticola TaxID=1958945 RepID=A0A419RW01_9SPHN|nr:DUF1810 domain-containing protein [Aurantiacibacter aquimixticola]RJY09958.1 DUF1810 family protein [Aurantiacibacter aquimixticola]